jgi:hypothetical protein
MFNLSQVLFDHNFVHMASKDDGVKSEDGCDINVNSSFSPALPNLSPSASRSSSSLTPSNLCPKLMHKQWYAKKSHAQQQAVMELCPPEDHHLKSTTLKKRMNLEPIPTQCRGVQCCVDRVGCCSDSD